MPIYLWFQLKQFASAGTVIVRPFALGFALQQAPGDMGVPAGGIGILVGIGTAGLFTL
jgi:hypothetical protein